MKNTLAIVAVCALLIGCTTPQVTTNPNTGQPSTNWVVDPRLTAGLTTAGAINAASAPVNPAFPFVEIALGAVAAIAAAVAKRKNDKASAAEKLTTTIIQGVEQSGATDVKATIEKHAQKMGVGAALSDKVYEITNR